MAFHSSILAWRIPMDRGVWPATVLGSQRVSHDRATNTFTFLSGAAQGFIFKIHSVLPSHSVLTSIPRPQSRRCFCPHFADGKTESYISVTISKDMSKLFICPKKQTSKKGKRDTRRYLYNQVHCNSIYSSQKRGGHPGVRQEENAHAKWHLDTGLIPALGGSPVSHGN